MMKIKFSKQITAVFFAVLLALGSIVSISALSDDCSSYYIWDFSHLLSKAEENELGEKLYDIGNTTDWQIIIYTSDEGVSAEEMDAYYSNQFDSLHSSYVEFVIDTGSDNRIILTHGSAMEYFTDKRMDEIKSNLRPYLNSGDMYGACVEFADTTLEFYNKGIPANGSYNNVDDGTENKFIYVLTHWGWIFAIVAIVAGGAFVGVNVGRYKFNGKSGTYNLKENSSVKLLDKQDVFLHKHTTYTTSSSSSSGGSSGGGKSGGSSHGSSGSF